MIRPGTCSLTTLLILIASIFAGPVLAQQTLSVEQLEARLAKKRAVLESVEQNRTETEQQSQEVQDQLDAREADLQRLETELKALCEEREKVEAGSFKNCMGADKG